MPRPIEHPPPEDLWPVAVCKSGHGDTGPFFVYAYCKTLTQALDIRNILSGGRGAKDGLWSWWIWDRQAEVWIPDPIDPKRLLDVIGRAHP